MNAGAKGMKSSCGSTSTRTKKKKIEKKLCGVIIIARQANTQQSFQEFCKQHISVMWLLLPLSLTATATTAADYDVVVVDFFRVLMPFLIAAVAIATAYTS